MLPPLARSKVYVLLVHVPLVCLLSLLGVCSLLINQTALAHANTQTTTVQIHLTSPSVVSQMSTGATYTQYSADSWNNATAVASVTH